MEKEIINEIRRISELMVLSENTTTNLVKWLRTFIADEGQIIRESLRKTDVDIEKALKKLTNNEVIEDKLLFKLIKNVEWDNVAKIIVKNNKLGSEFAQDVEKAIKIIYKDSSETVSIYNKFDDSIDELTYLKDGPLALVSNIKSEVRTKIDDGVKQLRTNAVHLYNTIKSEITSKPFSAKVWSKLSPTTQAEFETFVKSNITLGKEKEQIQKMAKNWIQKHEAWHIAGVARKVLLNKWTLGIGGSVLAIYLLYRGLTSAASALFSGGGGGELN